MGPHAEKVYHASAGKTITGSIVRVYAGAAAALDEVSFGKYVEGGDDIIYYATGSDIVIPEGTYLEGPIVYCKTKTAETLIYYNGNLTVS